MMNVDEPGSRDVCDMYDTKTRIRSVIKWVVAQHGIIFIYI